MKRNYLLFYLFTFFLLSVSCTQNAYEKGEGRYSQMVAEMVEAKTSSDGRVVSFVTDDDKQFTVNSPFTSKLMPKADTVYRAIFYYNKVEQGAEVVGTDRVGVVVPRDVEDLKTDPVKMESVWLAKSRRYLNLSVYLMLGAVNDDKTVQKLGCHHDTLMVNADGTKTLRLLLHHDQAGVPEYYSTRTYLSIPLADVDADSIWLSINTYDGLVSKKFRKR